MAPKCSIGDHVRITMKRKHFIKDTLKDGRKRFFKISNIQLTFPVTILVTYKITYNNWEETQGSFYEQELQKTAQDTFRIEKVLKIQGDKSHVKWLGYNDSFNSWVDNKDINNL